MAPHVHTVIDQTTGQQCVAAVARAESLEEDPAGDEMLSVNLMQEEAPVVVAADHKWVVSICVLSQEMQFGIDMGAKCNTLTLDS